MKKIKSILASILLVVLLILPVFSINSTSISNKALLDKYRVGAICCDGWESSSTGRGTCSHHGGVKYWIYYDDEKNEYTYVSTGRCD